MEFISNRIYQYTEIADMVAQTAIDHGYRIIGLTGTSSVGKSTFSKIIKDRIENLGYTAQVISVDNYLKDQFRAETNFWNRLDSTYLKPAHFDWGQLRQHMDCLIQGSSIEKEVYLRGKGWGSRHSFDSTDYIIIEGLFLDSVEASEFMTYDFLLALTADDNLVRALRIERDAYYRRTSRTFTRTEAETLLEIENTLRAGKSYTVYSGWERYLKLVAKGDYNATILKEL